MRWRNSAALRASLRFSSLLWMNEPRHTTVKKKTTTPSEKKVMMRSSVSPTRPSPLSYWRQRRRRERQADEEGEHGSQTRSHRRRVYRVGWRPAVDDGTRSAASSRSRRAAATSTSGITSATPRARPVPVLLGGVSDRLRLHPRHPGPGRRPARRHVLRVRAHLPRLHDRREAARRCSGWRTTRGSTTRCCACPCRTPAGTRWTRWRTSRASCATRSPTSSPSTRTWSRRR